MKVLVTMDLAGELVAEIGEVSEQVEVVQVASDEEALAVMPEIEVVCGKSSSGYRVGGRGWTACCTGNWWRATWCCAAPRGRWGCIWRSMQWRFYWV